MSNSAARPEERASQDCHYTLLVKERLPAHWSEAFEGLALSYTPAGHTRLAGYLPDQSALHGVLARIRDLNLTLIAVQRTGNQALADADLKSDEIQINQEERR